MLSYRSYKYQSISESIPLLLSQLNTSFIWACLACNAVGFYNFSINTTHILKENVFGFRDDAISILLLTAVNLEPLSLLLYTWRFFGTLQNEEENPKLRLVLKIVSWFTIILLPASFYAIFAAEVVEKAKYEEFLYQGKF